MGTSADAAVFIMITTYPLLYYQNSTIIFAVPTPIYIFSPLLPAKKHRSSKVSSILLLNELYILFFFSCNGLGVF